MKCIAVGDQKLGRQNLVAFWVQGEQAAVPIGMETEGGGLPFQMPTYGVRAYNLPPCLMYCFPGRVRYRHRHTAVGRDEDPRLCSILEWPEQGIADSEFGIAPL